MIGRLEYSGERTMNQGRGTLGDQRKFARYNAVAPLRRLGKAERDVGEGCPGKKGEATIHEDGVGLWRREFSLESVKRIWRKKIWDPSAQSRPRQTGYS